jgi:hypothetical protein
VVKLSKKIVKENSDNILALLTIRYFERFYINTFVYVFFLAVSKFSNKFYTEQLLITEKILECFEPLYDVQQNYLLGLGSVMIIVGLLNSIGLLIWELTTFFLWFLVLCYS